MCNLPVLVCFLPAGTYTLDFSTPTYGSVPPISMTVHVVNCSRGDVTVSSGDACQTCTRGSFSMDPRNNTCDQCVPNAECPGGYLVLPLPSFWKSAPSSIQMHRCGEPQLRRPGRRFYFGFDLAFKQVLTYVTMHNTCACHFVRCSVNLCSDEYEKDDNLLLSCCITAAGASMQMHVQESHQAKLLPCKEAQTSPCTTSPHLAPLNILAIFVPCAPMVMGLYGPLSAASV